MTKQFNSRKPPNGFYKSAWDWIVRANLQNRSKFYVKYKFDDTKPYNEPKGLEDAIHWKFIADSRRKHPPVYVAMIPHGRVWGAKGAVIAPDNKLLWDVSKEYFKNPKSHSFFKENKLPPVQHTKETVAVLTYCFSEIYYHWLFDVLARIDLLRRRKIQIDRIILNYNHDKPLSFQKETLSLLGIPQDKIIKCHKHFHLRAKRLVVPSLAGYSYSMPRWTCDFLRQEFLAKKNIQKIKGFARIYISRESARCRKVLNEDKVMYVLEKYGFKKVVLESMSVAEQVQLFLSAEIIISAHGSGLANLVFCNPGTKVLEIFSPNYIHVAYWILTHHVNLDYYYLIGEGKRVASQVSHHHYADNIIVNLKQLSDILKIMT